MDDYHFKFSARISKKIKRFHLCWIDFCQTTFGNPLSLNKLQIIKHFIRVKTDKSVIRQGEKKERRRMERALEELRVREEEAKAVEGLPVRAHRAGEEASFYEGFAVRGIRVDRIQPGFLSCSFTVPPRLTVTN